jgi:beta-lactam-binding protein with PASTA domain
MKSLICVVSILCFASALMAGEIFGTIVDAGKPVPEGTKIEVTVGGKSFTGATDVSGTYHVFAAEKGKGTLTAYYKDQKPAADLLKKEGADFIPFSNYSEIKDFMDKKGWYDEEPGT